MDPGIPRETAQLAEIKVSREPNCFSTLNDIVGQLRFLSEQTLRFGDQSFHRQLCGRPKAFDDNRQSCRQ